ncbi:MAG: SAF domain-containing protein, partial [Ornithinimicrobium sp.]
MSIRHQHTPDRHPFERLADAARGEGALRPGEVAPNPPAEVTTSGSRSGVSRERRSTRSRDKAGQRSGLPSSQTSRSGGRWQGRPRPRGLLVLAVLLVVGFGLATAYMVTRAGDRVSVLALGAPVAEGQVLQRSDLVSQAVSGVPGAVEVSRVNELVGQTATVDLLAGQVLTADMFTTEATPARGEAAVGLALDPTRVPTAGLEAGDLVDVIAVPASQGEAAAAPGDGTRAQKPRGTLNRPTVLARGASVFSVQGAAVESGQVLLTVVVDEVDSTRVAAYSTSGRI